MFKAIVSDLFNVKFCYAMLFYSKFVECSHKGIVRTIGEGHGIVAVPHTVMTKSQFENMIYFFINLVTKGIVGDIYFLSLLLVFSFRLISFHTNILTTDKI